MSCLICANCVICFWLIWYLDKDPEWLLRIDSGLSEIAKSSKFHKVKGSCRSEHSNSRLLLWIRNKKTLVKVQPSLLRKPIWYQRRFGWFCKIRCWIHVQMLLTRFLGKVSKSSNQLLPAWARRIYFICISHTKITLENQIKIIDCHRWNIRYLVNSFKEHLGFSILVNIGFYN